MSSISHWIATVFNLGRIPFAPGTWCSALAVLVWYFLLNDLTPIFFLIIIAVVVVLGVVTSETIVRRMKNNNDPSEIVIDELAGQWLALVGIPHTLGYGVAAFALFRVLDILKPPPLNLLEKMPGGWGVMMDDVVAGVLTCIMLNLYLFVS